MSVRKRKKKLKQELLVSTSIMFVIYIFFIVTDFMDQWMAYTRDYEEYELDELLGLLLGFAIGSLYLSIKLIIFYKADRSRIYNLLKELDFQANYDQLTGLQNRSAFREYTRELIENYSKSDCKFTLFYLDLDCFKHINDMLGYGVGDKLLIAVVTRLKSSIDDNGSIYRIGGDEFCIIQSGYTSDETCLLICNRFNNLISAPFNIDGHKLYISQTIGISRFPEDGDSYEQLLTIADIAMFMGKKSGQPRNNFKDDNFIAYMKRRFIVQHGLNDALKNNEFYIVYQPKVDLSTGAITGSEALVRWRHPVHGIINPDEFICVAEEIHSVHLIDLYVLEAVCKQLKKWGDKALPVAVNFSPMLFSDENFAENIFDLLNKHHTSHHLIKLEITERTIAVDSNIPLLVCKKIAAAGIAISLDDFGSGYSSLSHMTDYPISELKIDRSFTQRICESKSTKNTVSIIIDLAKLSNINVVAEGVETKEQYDLFKKLGCTQVQGYYIDKPLSVDDFTIRLTHTNLSR